MNGQRQKNRPLLERSLMPPDDVRSKNRILIVEDSRTQAKLLRHILEEDGFRVVIAESGTEALSLLAGEKPDLVLTDVVMPGMDGYDLCRTIKTAPQTSPIPVVLVTQLFDPMDVIRGVSAGADDFIVKPFEASTIRNRVAEILGRAGRPDPDGNLPVLHLPFNGAIHEVTAGRMQILNILLSTYEVAVSRNTDLQEAQDRLAALNDKLQDAVENLKNANQNLAQENSERRKAERALEGANRKLNLMANITRHDILNLLTLQHELLEGALARQQEKNPADAWSSVKGAAAVGTQAMNAIRFTGDYQKIGIKEPVWHNLQTLISQTRSTIPAGRVQIENQVPDNVQVYADPLIGTIFTNLVENALKYGMTLTYIRFTFAETDGSAVITCEDNGTGIAPDKKEKIFLYEHAMNTSMGLFLSREILALTKITIRETGEYKRGARFEINCPQGTFRRI